MPLTRTKVDVPLSSGLGQKSDVRSLEQSGAVAMTNCVRQKNGAITKRYGHYALNNVVPLTSSAIPAVVRGQNYDGTPLLTDGATLYSYSETAGQFTVLDAIPEAVALSRIEIASPGLPLPSSNAQYLCFDVACGAGYIATISCTSNTASSQGLVVSLLDANTGEATRQPIVLVSTVTGAGKLQMARCIIVGTTLLVGYTTSAGNLYIQTLSLATPNNTFSSATNMYTVVDGLFDMVPITGDATRFGLAFLEGTSITVASIQVATLNTLVAGQEDTVSSIVSIALRAVSGDSFWVCYASYSGGTTTFKGWQFGDVSHSAGSVLTLGTTASYITGSGAITMGLEKTATGVARAFWSWSASGAPGTLGKSFMQSCTISSSASSSVLSLYGVLLLSRPCAVTTNAGTRMYAMGLLPSILQGTPQLLCFDGAYGGTGFGMRLVATVSPRLMKMAGSWPTFFQAGSFVPNTALGANVWLAGILTVTQASEQVGTLVVQPFDFSSPLLAFGEQVGVELGGNAGAPWSFDGRNVVEQGYPGYPELISFSASATGGSMATGSLSDVYEYNITWEWTDSAGQIQRSGASPPLTVNLSALSAGNTGSVTLSLPTITTSLRQRAGSITINGDTFFATSSLPPIQLCVYRTTGGGTTPYLLNQIDTTVPTNVLTAATVSYTDTNADSAITSDAILYTDGGAEDNLCPASARVCIQHTTRWFLAGCDDPTVIWASKAFTTGEVPGFNEAFQIISTGSVTALASLDDKLIIFVQRGSAYGIEYLTGLGPNDEAGDSDWLGPQPIPSDVGAPDQRSICVGPFGVVFKSNVGGPNGSGGIFLLGRDLSVSYLSGPVEDLLATYATVNAMTLHPNAGRVYIIASNGRSSVRLVWDYIQHCWSEDLPSDYVSGAWTTFVNAATGWVANGIVNIPGVGTPSGMVPLYHWATAGGNVYRETTGTGAGSYVDTNQAGGQNWIPKTYQSAWIKPSMSGFARFWRVQFQGQVLDPSQLTTTLTFDYAPSTYYSESATWTDAQIATFDRYPQLDVQMVPGNQKAKAIQVTLTDAAPVGSFSTGRGADWATLSFELGVGDRAYPNLPAGQKA